MTVATMLLDLDDKYVDADGNLPNMRPQWDKEFLRSLVSVNVVSYKGYCLLPPSMSGAMIDEEYTLPLTVPEIDETADMLIVVRAYSLTQGGKKFRLDDFKQVVKSGQLEIWFRKD